MRIAILDGGGVGGYFGAPTSTTRAHSSGCHVTTTDACAMIPRRVFLGAAAVLPLATDNAFAQAPTVTPVHVQDLPDVRLDGWTATVVEVRYPPGGRLAGAPSSRVRARLRARRRDSLWGGWRRADHLSRQPGILQPPGVLHSVSANASPVNPARFLAILVAEKGAPITVTP